MLNIYIFYVFSQYQKLFFHAIHPNFTYGYLEEKIIRESITLHPLKQPEQQYHLKVIINVREIKIIIKQNFNSRLRILDSMHENMKSQKRKKV